MHASIFTVGNKINWISKTYSPIIQLTPSFMGISQRVIKDLKPSSSIFVIWYLHLNMVLEVQHTDMDLFKHTFVFTQIPPTSDELEIDMIIGPQLHVLLAGIYVGPITGIHSLRFDIISKHPLSQLNSNLEPLSRRMLSIQWPSSPKFSDDSK